MHRPLFLLVFGGFVLGGAGLIGFLLGFLCGRSGGARSSRTTSA